MADSQGRYADYSAGMGSDVRATNSNIWDVNNTGMTTGEMTFGENYDPNDPGQRLISEAGDFFNGKTGKEFMHGRFEVPGIEYQAQAYDPAAAAGQVGSGLDTRYAPWFADARNREAAQMQSAQLGAAGQAGASEFRQGQAGFMGELQSRAMGEGPSVAQLQLQQGLDQNIAAAKAMQAGSSNPALASRNASNAMTQAQLGTNQQMAQLRASEMQQAGRDYMGALSGARSQDQALNLANMGAANQFALQQGQFDQQAGQQNLAAQMQQRGYNDQMAQYYISQGFTEQQAKQKAAMDYEQMKGQQAIEVQKINADIAKANAEKKGENSSLGPQLLGSIFGSFM